jgi:hypothetical protein
MSDDQTVRAEPVRAPRLGLSGKLLVFTILFVMIAEVLIYVPSIALYRLMWLNDRLASAYTAALVLDAAPNGMVPDSLAKQILDSIGARAVAMKMGTQRRLLAVEDAPPPIADDFDMRHVYAFDSIVDAFKMMLNTKKGVMRVVGPAPMGGDYIEIIVDEPPLRNAMLRYSVDLLLISLLISGITAALVYLTLHYLFVRPMRQVTANMTAFRADPEDPDRIIVPSGRIDEIGTAERELAAMQTELASMLQQKSRLAALGLAVSKINHDLRNLLGSAQLFSDRLVTLPDPNVQRFAPKLVHALERAIAYCQSTLSYGRLQEPPPDRKPLLLEPLVEEVHETLGLSPECPIRLRPALPHPAEPRPQCRASAGKPRLRRPRPRPDPHHRPARGRCRGHRGFRHWAGIFREGAGAPVRSLPGLDPRRRHGARARHRRRAGARTWRRNPPGGRHDRRDLAADDPGSRGGIERPARRARAGVICTRSPD